MAISTKVSRSGLCFFLGTLWLAGAQTAACSSPFHSCYETRTCPAEPADEAGAAGEEAGGASGGAGRGLAGASGAGRTMGGASGGADLSSGDAGDAGAANGTVGTGGTGPLSCAADEYSNDTSCQKLTICATGEYQKTAPTSASDRVCAPWSVCGAGTSVSTLPTTTVDRACSSCAAGKFSNAVNAAQCTTWTLCAAGETESVAPSLTSDRVCSKCGAGKYESGGQCLSLTACTTAQYESTAATATSDRKCTALATCPAGSAQTAAPTATSNRQCAPCSAGQFSTQVNSTCAAWKVCTANQTQSVAGTATTDVVCVDKPVCGTAKDRACTTQCPCASAEGVCTASNQCASGASCVAGSGKKVGRTGDTCLATHCNNDQMDGGETSVDCGGECGCRATLEFVSYKNMPADAEASGPTPQAMSRDGKRLAGYVFHAGTYYPAAIAYDGTVSLPESYGNGGHVETANSDGSVLAGSIGCADPPSCTTHGSAAVRWSGSAAPVVVGPGVGSVVRAISSSGTICAGDFYDSDSSSQSGFLFLSNGLQTTIIPEFRYVDGMTPDGKYVVGELKTGTQGGLWFAQTQVLTKIGATTWSSTELYGVNGADPAVIGNGYISGSSPPVGFRWKGGVITELGLIAGGDFSTPNAISFDGSTVVGTTGTNSFHQAFIWSDSTKLRTIVDELKARGLEPAVDLQLSSSSFISDDGKTIVGNLAPEPKFWRVILQ